MATEATVLAELKAENNDKAKLMQKYSDQRQVILNKFGGNATDMPITPPTAQPNEFDEISSKMSILHNLIISGRT